MKEYSLSIGELAKLININPRTIRYYEEISLLPRPERGANNYRVYSEDTIKRLKFIKKAKSLGFTLNDIKRIITISDKGDDPCEHIGGLLKQRIVETDIRLKELKKLKTNLKKLEREWSGMQKLEVCNSDELICPKIEMYFNNK